jgi:hypothetical protein
MAQAKLAYDNNIKEAMLQNNAAIAEIYANTYKEQLELALQSYLNNQELSLDLANKKMELDDIKWNRYQDVYNRLFGEAQMAEDIRQYQETMKWNTEQKELDRQHESAENALNREFQKAEAELDRKFKEAQAALDRQHDKDLLKAKNDYEKEQLEIQHKNAMAQLSQKLANDKAMLKYEYDLKKAEEAAATRKQTSQAVQAAKDRVSGYKTGSVSNTSTGFTGTTYNQAVSYLKSKGISTGGLYTLSEWSQRSGSYSLTGQGSAAVRNNKTYQDYLKEYVEYKVETKHNGKGGKF